MAELHCRWLFDGACGPASVVERKDLSEYAVCTMLLITDTGVVGRVLRVVSQQMESLEALAGLQSFFLVVDPNDPADEGFLGGTIKGREFWRGHRGCGVAGAQAFKAQCLRAQTQLATPTTMVTPLPITVPPSASGSVRKKTQAREVKTELYGAMRDSLR